MVFNAQLSQSQEIRFLMCLRARVLGSVAGNQAICELFFATVYLFVFISSGLLIANSISA